MNKTISFEEKIVLLVEDELFLVEKISDQLAALGVRHILTATNLSDAEELVAAHVIDVALLDVNLARGDTTKDLGAGLASRSVAVVFFSGISAADSVSLSTRHEFIEKPLSVSRLKTAIQRALLRVSTSPAACAERKMAGPEARQ